MPDTISYNAIMSIAKIKIEWLHALIAIAEKNSFSKAAEDLQCSASQISRYIANLESHLGIPLIQRTTRALYLTDNGAQYLESARKALNLLRIGEDNLAYEQQQLQGNIRISVPHKWGEMIFMERIHAFLNQYPLITMDVDFDDRIVDIVREKYDLAVRITDATDMPFVSKKLEEITLRLYASPNYLAQHGTPQSLKELVQHPCISQNDTDVWAYTSGKKKHFIKIPKKIQSNNDNFLLKTCMNDQGIALLPNFFVDEYVQSGQLVHLLPNVEWMKIYAWILYPQEHRNNKKLKTFVDWFVHNLKTTKQ